MTRGGGDALPVSVGDVSLEIVRCEIPHLTLQRLAPDFAPCPAGGGSTKHPLAHRRGYVAESRQLRRSRCLHAPARCVRARVGPLHTRVCHRAGLLAVALLPHHRDVCDFDRHAAAALGVSGAGEFRAVHGGAARGGLLLLEQCEDGLQSARRAGIHSRGLGRKLSQGALARAGRRAAIFLGVQFYDHPPVAHERVAGGTV